MTLPKPRVSPFSSTATQPPSRASPVLANSRQPVCSPRLATTAPASPTLVDSRPTPVPHLSPAPAARNSSSCIAPLRTTVWLGQATCGPLLPYVYPSVLELITTVADSPVIDILPLNATCSTAFWVTSTTAFRPARHTLRPWPFQSPMQSPLDNCFPGMSRHNPITSLTNCCPICLPAPDGDRLVGYTLLPENGCALVRCLGQGGALARGDRRVAGEFPR